MKKSKIILIAAIIVTSTFVTSCSSNNSDSRNNDTEQATSNSTVNTTTDSSNKDKTLEDSKDKTVDNSKDQTKDDSKNKAENFYGKWTINKLVKYGKVSALSQEDINGLIGQTIEFSSSKITFKGKSYTNPIYSLKDMTNDEFQADSYISFSDLEIKGNNVTEISIDSYDNMNELLKENKELPGFSLLYAEDGSLIMAMEGDFFKLTK